jgi:polysaccharide export outer membrane protein
MCILNKAIRFVSFLALIVFVLSACVPNRKVQMLQKNDVNTENTPKDSVMRMYALDTFEYRLQPNDVLYVQVKAVTDKEGDTFNFFNSSVGQGNIGNINAGGAQLGGDLINESGEIILPVIGKVKVAGLTVFEAQEKLQGIIEGYIEFPMVKVRLVNFRFTMLGEVVREGTIVLTNNRVTMLEAIAQGGGFGDLADRANVKLIRQRNGNTEVAYVDLLKEDFFYSPYYYVYQNDVLVVPPLKQRPFRKYFGQNLALIISSISLILLTVNIIQNN